MRYKITFSYDGTNFNGYQIQPKLRTMQEELEKAVSFINKKKPTEVVASGRTDKGVHAIEAVAHFDLNTTITDTKLKLGLNSILPEDINVIKAERVDDNFHARYNTKKKEYIYKINTLEYDPLTRNYIYQFNNKLDLKSMKKAIKYFKGTHDFTSFISSEEVRDDKVRTIYQTKISYKKGIITISFIGDGFMKYQVRSMVGLLIEIGRAKKKPNEVERLLTKKNRTFSAKTAPANGLYLKKVWY